MKMDLVGIVFLLVLAVLVMVGCATTQEQASTTDNRALCAVLDTNQDGKITKEEFMARATDKNKALEVYQKCDTGNKGYLSYDEVISNRFMVPPELIITTTPVLAPRR